MARYVSETAEQRMDRLLQSRDLALECAHTIMLGKPAKATGVVGHLETYERLLNLIERIENAHTKDTAKDIKINLVFQAPPEAPDEC